MYIGASDLCNRIVIDMDQDLQYTRLWDIKAEYRPLTQHWHSDGFAKKKSIIGLIAIGIIRYASKPPRDTLHESWCNVKGT